MIAGIIPGAGGAITIIAPDGRLVHTSAMLTRQADLGAGGQRWQLDTDKLVALLDDTGVDVIVMERVSPPETPKKALSLGLTTGLILGIAAALGMEQRRYWSRAWRDDLSIPSGDYLSAVERVYQLTSRHWPEAQFDQSHRQRLAALLALYAVQCSHVPPPAYVAAPAMSAAA